MPDEFRLCSPSGSLTVGSASSAPFTQQGQIDWVNLIKYSLSATIDIFSRISAGQVDPYTTTVGQVLCTQFHLSPAGRLQVAEALHGLSCFSSLASGLWFGFGVRSVVRTLASTDEGGILVAICACIKECYHEHVGADILVEMTKSSQAPDHLKPSILQWMKLLAACAGTFAATQFPIRAEMYMKLRPDNGTIRLGSDSGNGRGCSSAESVARALLALGKISRGTLSSITIIGDADAGWLAAVAETLFSLSIRVVDQRGNLLYTNQRAEDLNVQLLIMFRSAENDAPRSQGFELIGETYHLVDATELIKDEASSWYAAAVGGRVEWKNALSCAFGSDFRKLLENRQALGGAIGSAARVFRAISCAEKNAPSRYRAQCRTYCDTSYGTGLVQNITHIFPELKSIQQPMEEAARQTNFNKAKATYESNLTILRTACDCKLCQGLSRQDDEDGEDEWDEKDKDDVEDLDESWEEKYCLVALTETIIDVARTLSAVTIAPNLRLSRIGLELFYRRHHNMRSHQEREALTQYFEEIGQILFVLDLEKGFQWEDVEDLAEIRLLRTLELFGGRQPEPPAHFATSALTLNGMTAFLGVLQDLSDTDDSVGRVFIVPGHIELHSKTYPCLEDLRFPANVAPASLGTDPATIEYPAPDAFQHLSVLVKESSQALQIAFNFKISSEELSSKDVRLGPAELASLLAKRRGLVHCRRNSCTSKVKVTRVINEGSNHETVVIGHRRIEIYQGGIMARCVVLSLRTLGDVVMAQRAVFLVDKECRNCSLQEAIATDEDRALIVVASGSRNYCNVPVRKVNDSA